MANKKFNYSTVLDDVYYDRNNPVFVAHVLVNVFFYFMLFARKNKKEEEDKNSLYLYKTQITYF